MRIIFGWYSYLLKRFTREELGMAPDAAIDVSLEYRQRCFHIFFIPCFPIGRFWGVRQAGKLYHPSDELKDILREVRPGNKHAVWAWSGPLLAIAIYVFSSINTSLEEKAYQERMQVSTSLLNAFFKDKSKTEPMLLKLNTINALVDSAMAKDEYIKKPVDTSESNIIRLFMEAELTQADSLSGYTPFNTLVATHFHSEKGTEPILSESYYKALQSGSWEGHADTATVLPELRKLADYKYILVLKEYGHVSPVMADSTFNSGYSLMNAYLVDIQNGKLLKKFKLLGHNSKQVRQFSFSSGGRDFGAVRLLEADLKKNTLSKAEEYVFHEKRLGTD